MKYLFNYFKKVRFYVSGFLFLFIILINGCTNSNVITDFAGKTMGTTYTIKINSLRMNTIEKMSIQQKIDSVLLSINDQMSTYIDDSEISRFNNTKLNEPFKISNEFFSVVNKSKYLYDLSDGAFDITIKPLVSLWGFGKYRNGIWVPPSSREISEKIKNVNGDYLIIGGLNYISKLNPNLELDVNAIAKGFVVDAIHQTLFQIGYKNIMVEIGGEVRCSGKKRDDNDWQIGIELPETDSREIGHIIRLKDASMATSGDYRNYFEYEGARYSHTLDPRSGYPISHGLASVTVLFDTCAEADAWATALMVMGTHEGMELANQLGLSVYMISRVNSGFEISISEAFDGIQKLSLKDDKSTEI